MNKQPTTLEQRIAAALEPDDAITSADITALIEQGEAAIAKTEKERDVEQTLALDPTAARQAIEDATFAANRLRTLLSKLQERQEEVVYQEEVTAWLAEYDVRKRERDALAEELRAVYPDVVTRIMDVFDRMIANDHALSALHQARPGGVKQHLLSAELHARGLDHFTRDVPSLLTSVHLIDWDSGRQAWPPPRPSIAAAVAATVPAFDRRFSADWAKDNERRAAAQQAEQQRIADYYARLTREQEERQNREARERFAASQRRNRD